MQMDLTFPEITLLNFTYSFLSRNPAFKKKNPTYRTKPTVALIFSAKNLNGIK